MRPACSTVARLVAFVIAMAVIVIGLTQPHAAGTPHDPSSRAMAQDRALLTEVR
jgi:hypothetical protein